jgi:hypothetical protein
MDVAAGAPDETRVLFLFPEAGASFSFAASSE